MEGDPEVVPVGGFLVGWGGGLGLGVGFVLVLLPSAICWPLFALKSFIIIEVHFISCRT